MNRQTLKTALATSALLLAAGYTQMASAHCYDNRFLAASAGSADLYRIRCATGTGGPGDPSLLATNKLFARVDLQTATVVGQAVALQLGREGVAPNASVLVSDATGVAGGTTDPVGDGSCLAYNASGQTALVRGNGDYNILVSKIGGNAKTYGIVFHCQDVNGLETHTTEVANGFASPELAGNASLSPDIDLLIDR